MTRTSMSSFVGTTLDFNLGQLKGTCFTSGHLVDAYLPATVNYLA